MPLTETDLEILSRSPADTEADRIQHTRDMIYNAIEDFFPKAQVQRTYGFANLDYNVYLQGSYKNSTNTRLNSDVDIVVELQNVYSYDVTNLPILQRTNVLSQISATSYGFGEYKGHVLSALRERFGYNAVEEGNKSLKIRENTSRVNADIVPSFQHKHYKTDTNYIEGIALYTTQEFPTRRIINFPKHHYENSASKNQATYGRYKPMVRIFKNIRHRLIENRLMIREDAPSYYIENLLFNVPNQNFTLEKALSLNFIILYLNSALTAPYYTNMYCANGIDQLFDQNQWNVIKAQNFLNLVARYYQN